PRCATLLDEDARICDECAGTRLVPLERMTARLCGWAGERPVVFAVSDDKPSIIGRSAGEQIPDVDLRRLIGSEMVHRQHARIERTGDHWCVTHLGDNALVLTATRSTELATGETVRIHSGDMLQVGTIVLQFVAL